MWKINQSPFSVHFSMKSRFVSVILFFIISSLLSVSWAGDISIEGRACVCSGEFIKAFGLFSDRNKNRLSCVSDRVKLSHIDVRAKPEPVAVVYYLENKAKISEKLNSIDGLINKGDKKFFVEDNQAKVRINFPDTDYQVVLHFLRSGECWKLVFIDDQSL